MVFSKIWARVDEKQQVFLSLFVEPDETPKGFQGVGFEIKENQRFSKVLGLKSMTQLQVFLGFGIEID